MRLTEGIILLLLSSTRNFVEGSTSILPDTFKNKSLQGGEDFFPGWDGIFNSEDLVSDTDINDESRRASISTSLRSQSFDSFSSLSTDFEFSSNGKETSENSPTSGGSTEETPLSTPNNRKSSSRLRRLSTSIKNFISRNSSRDLGSISNNKEPFFGIPYTVADFLPTQFNPQCFDDEREKQLARVLYSDPTSYFEQINEPEHLIVARVVSFFGKDERSAIYNQMIEDMSKTDFYTFLIDIQNRKQKLDIIDEYFDLDLLKNSTEAFVSGLIGRGCTLNFQDNYKLLEFYENTLVTPKDFVYHRGLNRLAALFVSEFDPNRADAFFYQFVKTAYSGVYGPLRSELRYITRIENIPLNPVTPEDRKYFLDPSNRDFLRSCYTRKQLCYKPLIPVPKTLDDVLDATVLILRAYRDKFDQSNAATEKFIRDPANIEHLQTFYLDLGLIEEVLELLEMIPIGPYQPHFAAFCYAAFIQFTQFHRGFNVHEIKKTLKTMLESLEIDLEALDAIHEQSIKVAEI